MATNPNKRVDEPARIDYRRGIGRCNVCSVLLSKQDAAYINPIVKYMICKNCATDRGGQS